MGGAAIALVAVGLLMAGGTAAADEALGVAETRYLAADYAGAEAAVRRAPSSDATIAMLNKIAAQRERVATTLAEMRNTVDHAAELGPASARATLERLRDAAPDEPTRRQVVDALAKVASLPPASSGAIASPGAPGPRPSAPSRAPFEPPAEPATRAPRRVLDEAPPADGFKARRADPDDAPAPEPPPASRASAASQAESAREVAAIAREDSRAGRYRRALELLTMASGEAGASREALEAEAAAVREEAGRAYAYLTQRADELERSGRDDEALTMLFERIADFPADAGGDALRARVERLGLPAGSAALRAAAPPPAAPEPPAGFAYDEMLRRREAGAAEDAARAQAAAAKIAAAVAAEPPKEIDAGAGRRGPVLAVDSKGVTIAGAIGRETVPWADLPPASLRELVARAGAPEPGVRLGLALLLAGANAVADADAELKRAVDADPALQPAVDAILARRRGIESPSYGFVWHRERWMTFRERETEKLTAQIREKLTRLESAPTPADRDRIAAEIEALGHDAADALRGALEEKRAEHWKKARGTGIGAKLAALEAERAKLDAARAHALALIFDEKAYFYPYKPPECPPEKAKLYRAVQEDVEKRAAAVAEAWSSKTAVAYGAAKAPVRLLVETDRRLRELRATPPPADEEMERVLALDPDAEEVTLRTYARTREERARLLDVNRRVATFNATVETSQTPEEKRQVEVTNGYREMFGRRALAVNERLVQAARKHSVWMEKSGVFSHFSTLPGLRTPFDRMRAEGYRQGVSENIALAFGPDAAHLGWITSSGHHRNILMVGHTEMGSGASGTHWSQEFGHGDEYRKHSRWPE